jgi:hypothetical protein
VVYRSTSNADVLRRRYQEGDVSVQRPGRISEVHTVGKIQRVPLREVWKHEALSFTTWLRENIDVLGDALNKSLSNVEREQAAGDFSVDLVAEDESGEK